VVERSKIVHMTQISESFAKRWGGKLSLTSTLSSSAGGTPATRNQVDLSTYRPLSRSNYFVNTTAGFLQSSVQEISRQTLFAGSIGRFLKNTNRVRLTVLGGLGWRGNIYTPSGISGTQDIGAALVSSDLQAFSFKKSHLDLTATLVPAVTESGRVFAKFNASYYLKVFRKIDWNLSFYGNWDTQPPAHFSAGDYGSSIGLSYGFGNK
jgi:hypothetical protein